MPNASLEMLTRKWMIQLSFLAREEEKKKMKRKSKSVGEKVQLNIRLDHQVEFGERVVILGSSKELGSWKKEVPMDWTESGWACNLQLKGGESIECKFVIVTRDEAMIWEGGDNRVLKVPKGGNFGLICHWNATSEAMELLPLVSEEEVEDLVGNDENGSAEAAASLTEVETSPFVGQWQGKAVSFMRSKEHRNRESERKWDTTGLEGLALKLVEGDRSARNWWRKVSSSY